MEIILNKIKTPNKLSGCFLFSYLDHCEFVLNERWIQFSITNYKKHSSIENKIVSDFGSLESNLFSSIIIIRDEESTKSASSFPRSVFLASHGF